MNNAAGEKKKTMPESYHPKHAVILDLVGATFAVYENRCRVTEILREMVRLDHMAECIIGEYLKKE